MSRRPYCGLTPTATRLRREQARTAAAQSFGLVMVKAIRKFCKQAEASTAALRAAKAEGLRIATPSVPAAAASPSTGSTAVASGVHTQAVEPAHPMATWRAQRRSGDPAQSAARRRLEARFEEAARVGSVHAAGFAFSTADVERAAALARATHGVTGPAPRLDEAPSIG